MLDERSNAIQQQLAEQAGASDDVKALLHFIESGERPLQR